MTRHARPILALLLATMLAGCGQGRGNAPAVPDGRVKALADTYLAAYFDRYPDQATYYGVPNRHHDRLPDNSLDSLRAWQEKEDQWLVETKAIDPSAIQVPPLRATYAIVREALESSIGARVCRNELWNVSQMTGWHINYGYLVTIQPVQNVEARKEALARWSALPRYLDTEIANLREGIRLRITAPKLNVRIVIGQMDGLLAGAPADSPFMSPVSRDPDKDAAFDQPYAALYNDQLAGAFRRYRDFLEKEYLPAAREDIAVAANPNGAACYAASVRQYSSLPISARAIHQTGVSEMDRLMEEMATLAERAYNTSDVPALLQRFRTDREFMFRNRQELIDYSAAALARAKLAVPAQFNLVPRAGVSIEPYPAYREKNGSSEYNPPAEDGSRPALFYINAYQAETKSKAPAESTAFHETIPGHHLQMGIALERKEIHPIGRYIFNSGYVEGWALYAERLADDMHLYSSDLDRMGMLSSQAFRAARLVVDSGLHTMGWSRQQAIDYLLAHTAESPGDITAEVDRYIIYPGQATAYTLGMLQIESAHDGAKEALGDRFDLKAFHDRVLEDGAVPLTFLASKVRSWATIPR